MLINFQILNSKIQRQLSSFWFYFISVLFNHWFMSLPELSLYFLVLKLTFCPRFNDIIIVFIPFFSFLFHLLSFLKTFDYFIIDELWLMFLHLLLLFYLLLNLLFFSLFSYLDLLLLQFLQPCLLFPLRFNDFLIFTL